jgi:hypothetical protein
MGMRTKSLFSSGMSNNSVGIADQANGRRPHIRGDDGREGWVLAVTVRP